MGSVEGNAAIYNPSETLQQNLANYNIRRPMGAELSGPGSGQECWRGELRICDCLLAKAGGARPYLPDRLPVVKMYG